MVTALLVGLVVGFVMVMPPGPIAMACMRQALAGHTKEGLALGLGAAVMDSGYALLAAFASSALVEALWDMMMHHAWALLAFQGGCIVVLVVVGLHYCRSSRHGGAARARPEARGRLRGDVSPALSGVLLALTNLANPMFLPSLIFVMSLLQVRGWVGHAVGDHIIEFIPIKA
jgi:threonine/homoserine/homoserine lactone efflux protein